MASLFAKRQKARRVGREPGTIATAGDEEGMFQPSTACRYRSDLHSQLASKR